MLNEHINNIQEFIEVGGFIMPPLIALTILLWYALGHRFSLLKRGSKRSVRELIGLYAKDPSRPVRGIVDSAAARGVAIKKQNQVNIRKHLDDSFNDFREPLNKYSRFLVTVVGIAPLAGLLGTVTGMIETFDSLGDMAMFTQTGGIAGGISQALFTTQMGLAIAIPGLIVERLLKKRQTHMEIELAQIKDILCSEPLPENRV